MPPTKLAHVVFRTNRMKEIRQWCWTVLGGRVGTRTRTSPS